MLKIISGGQTGVDRAALDVALAHEIACGGWCPKGRMAEGGVIPARYPLTETPSDNHAEQATSWNVRDSDGTLILVSGTVQGGTKLTIEMAALHRKPCLVVDLDNAPPRNSILSWWIDNRIRILNVAGPRATFKEGWYQRSHAFLDNVLTPIFIVDITRLDTLRAFAARLVQEHPNGVRVGLCGELGAGKTTLVRDCISVVADKCGAKQPRVISPSFVIHQMYEDLRPSVEHFDFYRLQDPRTRELSEIGYFDALERQQSMGGYLFVEWVERAGVTLHLDGILYFEVCGVSRRILGVFP